MFRLLGTSKYLRILVKAYQVNIDWTLTDANTFLTENPSSLRRLWEDVGSYQCTDKSRFGVTSGPTISFPSETAVQATIEYKTTGVLSSALEDDLVEFWEVLIKPSCTFCKGELGRVPRISINENRCEQNCKTSSFRDVTETHQRRNEMSWFRA